MVRKVTTTIKIEDVFFDKNIYPRADYSWKTGYDYSQSILSGAKFPPIVLASYKGKKYLIDGKHRLEAHKLLKKKKIKAEILFGLNLRQMLEEAIKLNIAHGRSLTVYEKGRLALKLKKMKYPDIKVSGLLNIPEHSLRRFIAQRLINSITGEVISETIVKGGSRHLAGKSYSKKDFNKIEAVQQGFYSSNQVKMLDEIIEIIENGLLDVNNKKVVEKIGKLKELLEGLEISLKTI